MTKCLQVLFFALVNLMGKYASPSLQNSCAISQYMFLAASRRMKAVKVGSMFK